MNDATEFESSLTGTIDFFQNLRRKLGALETEAGVQQELLRGVTGSMANLEQHRQTDQQALAALGGQLDQQMGQLAKLQDDVRLLGQQLSQIDTLAGNLSQEQAQARHALALAIDELGNQSATLREELEASFTRRSAPLARVANLEEQLAGKAHDIESLLSGFQSSAQDAKAVRERVAALESQFEQFDQNTRSTTQALTDLRATVERHGQTQDSLGQILEASQALAPQLQNQQARLDDLTESSTTLKQDMQGLRQDFSHLTTEFEHQRQAQAENVQTRQDLQKQQDRLRYLETLITKLSADTSSARQILNVLQSDMAAQNDALREFDQTWREGLIAYQTRLNDLEHAIAKADQPAASVYKPPSNALVPAESLLLDASAESPFLDPPNESPFLEVPAAPAESPFLTVISEDATPTQPVKSAIAATDQPFEELIAALASTREDQQALREGLAASLASASEEQQELRLDISTIRDTLETQHQYLGNLRDIIAEQLQTQQQRLGQLETTLEVLQLGPRQETDQTDFSSVREAIGTHAELLQQLQSSVEPQLEAQGQRLDAIDAALAALSPQTATTPESGLQPLRETLVEHAGALDLLRQNTQQQFDGLATTLDGQRSELREAVERIASIQQDLQHLQQQQHRFEALDQQRRETGAESPDGSELRHHFATLQDSVSRLENRLSGQAQAFTSNFEQFQSLHADVQALQQHVANLEPSQRLNVLEQDFAAREQEIAQLTDDLHQLKRASQPNEDDGQGAKITALEEKLNRQHQQLSGLSAALDTVRTDSRATQEKVLTMAANVAQRLHEFQNQLIASKTAQGEQLQGVEQKLTLLQATVETLESQRKSRRWFSMPASFTTVAITVGAALLAVVAQVIWTMGSSS
ncbi:MAG TPA: hypothetical protein DIC59_03025 [Candidatus Competibacteraceae bacterium]|nr:hypothetical protein [Candidatus Competibacteraceae bacterium]